MKLKSKVTEPLWRQRSGPGSIALVAGDALTAGQPGLSIRVSSFTIYFFRLVQAEKKQFIFELQVAVNFLASSLSLFDLS